MIFFSIVGLLLFADLFSSYVTYGKFVNDKTLKRVYEAINKAPKANPFDPKIISGNRFVFTNHYSFFSSLYIYDIGQIPKWSKYNKLFKELQFKTIFGEEV